MEEYIYHTVDAGHIRNIGEQSVSNKIQAILELVKNAYDADSPDCTVTFHGTEDGGRAKIHKITIEDRGVGMTKGDLRDKFMKVGTGTKIEETLSPKLGRRVSGEKGMGHYSAQRLGDRITITTTPEPFGGRLFSKEDDTTYVLELDWSKYVSGMDFGKIPNTLRMTARRQPGTVVEISGLRDSWTAHGGNNDLETLAKNLGNVMLPKEMQAGAKDKFYARIRLEGFEADLPEPRGTLLDHAPYKIQASLRENYIRYQLFRRNKGNTAMHPIKDGTAKAKNATCGNASITINWFPGAVSEWAEGAMAPRHLKGQLNENYGIKIYNDKIRVMPYGEKGDDWLGLGTRKSGPASGGMVRNVHLVGFLRLSRNDNPGIMETTTRQALRENSAFKSLKEDFVMPVIEEMEAGVQNIEEEEESLAKKLYHINIAKLEIERLKKAAERLPVETGIKDRIGSGLTKVSRQISLQTKEDSKKEERLLTNLEMYRNLSTVGIQTIAFNHEIIDPIRIIKTTLTNLVNRHEDVTPEQRRKYLEKCLNKVVSALNWANHIREFSSLLSGPDIAKKQRAVISIDEALRDIRDDLSLVLNAMHITMRDPIVLGDIPDIAVSKASFESIFINLISNSVRSLKKAPRDKKMIQASISTDDTSIRIEFADNGWGIDEDMRDKIFRPFFTTYKNPTDMGTGMGLTIVREIVEEEYGGKVTLVEAVSEEAHPGRGMAKFLVRLSLDAVKVDN